MICPCCGHPITAPIQARELAGAFGPTHFRSLSIALAEAYPRALTKDQLLGVMYAGAREPEGAYEVLKATLPKLRKALQPYGWTVSKSSGGRGQHGRYRLIKWEPTE